MTSSTGAPSRARSNYHHGDLEHALVTAALAQVRDHGADAVSLRQVAHTLGVSPSAAYAHFPDKNALMAAVGSRGMEVLDARMVRAIDAHPGDDDASAIARFRAVGEAYVRFALEEPHLFRHVFGPTCALEHAKDPEHMDEESVAYQVLNRSLDDLQSRGLLRDGVREGLDVVAWTMVHGFSALVLDGLLPAEAGEQLIDALGRLALTDAARPLIPWAAGRLTRPQP